MRDWERNRRTERAFRMSVTVFSPFGFVIYADGDATRPCDTH
jgi:hypothetical protein